MLTHSACLPQMLRYSRHSLTSGRCDGKSDDEQTEWLESELQNKEVKCHFCYSDEVQLIHIKDNLISFNVSNEKHTLMNCLTVVQAEIQTGEKEGFRRSLCSRLVEITCSNCFLCLSVSHFAVKEFGPSLLYIIASVHSGL